MSANLELPTVQQHQAPWPTWDQIDSGREFPSPTLFKPAVPLRNVVARLHPARHTSSDPSLRLVTRPILTTRQIEISTVVPNIHKKELYNAWVEFFLLPAFMRGSTDVSLTKPYANRWSFRLGDDDVRWEAQTNDCVPGEMISWQGTEDAVLRNWGRVTLSDIGLKSSQVSVNLEFDGPGATRLTAQALRRVESQLRDTIEILKTFLGPCALPSALHSL